MYRYGCLNALVRFWYEFSGLRLRAVSLVGLILDEGLFWRMLDYLFHFIERSVNDDERCQAHLTNTAEVRLSVR